MPCAFATRNQHHNRRNRIIGLLFAVIGMMAGAPTAAETLTGRAMIDTGMALPSGLTFEAVIEDISRAGAPAQVIGRTVIDNPGQPPIDFAIGYKPADLRAGAILALRATIHRSGEVMFSTDTLSRVLSEGATGPVEVRLRPVARPSGTSSRPVGAHGLRLPASFTGVLPCADCEGIRHHLDLWPDQVYQMRRDWLGRAEGPLHRNEVGRWYADPGRGAIVLYGASEMPLFWEVKGPDRLRQMDMAGDPIISDLPYDLTSDDTLKPTDLDALVLSGEVTVGPEGTALRECLTGRVFPVETDGAFADLVAAVEAQSGSDETPFLVTVEARITQPQPGLAPQFPRLTVLRFVNAFPGESCTRPRPTADLVNTYWRIDSLMGEDLPAVAGRREPHLVLMDAPEARFRATVGCNQLIGTYQRDGDSLTFAAGASTMMACPPPLDRIERDLRDVLSMARHLRLEGESLELLGEDGTILAALGAVYLR